MEVCGFRNRIHINNSINNDWSYKMARKNQYGERKTDEEVFIENSTYARHRLKERIIVSGKLS